ncbi:hypothetical protein GFS31_41060 (plasmid) [Leptolyngbya sp. BL0902]|uniref:hypothetical protein n=1 Tax=Leptolyngbya sp. BL0902 TaxID=1115757 RepID=UPI0018E7E1A6|nr:hypothetical protein [Leptolyngbya sp. BL0902]QQE67393.1 hypothetical protein GFS31_41060 [Leptolyngbya sp. BL0902]
MKTLIITVGTRQVGWRCKDGVVRSLGADGSKSDPAHIDELYQDELGLERGHHQDEGSARPYPWSVWDLGHRLYQHCQGSGFQNVELLLDQVILNQYLPQGLSHVVLWGTQQPESVSWNYRRMDTAWLSELMAGKLRERYPELSVKVFRPTVGAVDAEVIRDVLESELLPFALGTRQLGDDDFTLLIENKGATPAMSEGLSICAAALVRDCQVVTVSPIEARPLYPQLSDAVKTVTTAQECRAVNLGQYFWPLERERILSAWKRGDFAEARVWLSAHRDRYQALYDLAEYLALASNWQLLDALQGLQIWLNQTPTKRKVLPDVRKQWLKDIEILCKSKQKQTPESRYFSIWESRLAIYVNLHRHSYTSAFLQFVQVIERLLFWRYQNEDWIEKGYVTPPESKKNWGVKYKATFWDLRNAWKIICDLQDNNSLVKTLAWMNDMRNDIVHKNEPLHFDVFVSHLNLSGETDLSDEKLYQAIEIFIQQFCQPDCPIPDRSLLQDLYHWGIEQLQS